MKLSSAPPVLKHGVPSPPTPPYETGFSNYIKFLSMARAAPLACHPADSISFCRTLLS